MTGNKKIENQNNHIFDDQGSSRVISWHHFKPYLSLLGQLVWVLEGFYAPRHFSEHHFFPDNKNFDAPKPKFLKKIPRDKMGHQEFFLGSI